MQKDFKQKLDKSGKELFEKYNSIESGIKSKNVSDVANVIDVENTLFYTTEKIHGTNFSFILDGVNPPIPCQRSKVTEAGFFNCGAYLHTVENKMIALQKEIGKRIQVYGEFCGAGICDGKGHIKYFKDPNKKGFVFFDIYLIDEDKFMSYPQNFELFDKYEIPRVPVLERYVKFNESITLNPEFDSFFAEEKHNRAEGYVVKPCDDIRFNHGGRVILKFVSEAFKESKNVVTKENFNPELSQSIINAKKDYAGKISPMVTSVRVEKRAAENGISSEYKANFKVLLKSVFDDVKTDFLKEESNTWIPEYDLELTNEIVPLVKEFFGLSKVK